MLAAKRLGRAQDRPSCCAYMLRKDIASLHALPRLNTRGRNLLLARGNVDEASSGRIYDDKSSSAANAHTENLSSSAYASEVHEGWRSAASYDGSAVASPGSSWAMTSGDQEYFQLDPVQASAVYSVDSPPYTAVTAGAEGSSASGGAGAGYAYGTSTTSGPAARVNGTWASPTTYGASGSPSAASDWGSSDYPGEWGELSGTRASGTSSTQPEAADFSVPADGSEYRGYDAFGAVGDPAGMASPGATSWPPGPGHGAYAMSGDQQGFAAADGATAATSGIYSGSVPPSDITLLTACDQSSIMPVMPSTTQANFYQPRTLQERIVQVFGSLGLSVVLSKSAIIAGPALLYPIWGPWIRAGLRNLELAAKQFRHVGLWRAQVLQVDVSISPYSQFDFRDDTISITVGDPWPGGARADLVLPYVAGANSLQIGEPAELLVLSQTDQFAQFKVVREVYLPESGLWLGEYPFVARDIFLDISLQVERARQAGSRPRPSVEAAVAGGGVGPDSMPGFGMGGAASIDA